MLPDIQRVFLKIHLPARTLCYGTNEGPEEYVVTTEYQGSSLGALSLNVMYNGALAIPVPEKAMIICFTDDQATRRKQ